MADRMETRQRVPLARGTYREGKTMVRSARAGPCITGMRVGLLEPGQASQAIPGVPCRRGAPGRLILR